jgi:hypothetical protein
MDKEISSGSMGGSTFSLYSNIVVLKNSLFRSFKSFIFGNGWNSHRFLYDEFSSQFSSLGNLGQNRVDAGSMYIRGLSEFGILGFIFSTSVICKHKLKKSNSIYYIINFSAFITLLSYMLRSGNYANIIPTLMLILLIYSYLKEKNNERGNEFV